MCASKILREITDVMDTVIIYHDTIMNMAQILCPLQFPNEM